LMTDPPAALEVAVLLEPAIETGVVSAVLPEVSAVLPVLEVVIGLSRC